MTYVKQTWTDNDITKSVSAARMNYIETGIYALNSKVNSGATHGMLFSTVDPMDCNGNPFAFSTQVWLGTRCYDVPPLTITNLIIPIGTAGSALTLAQVAVYTISGNTATQVAITASQHSDWSSVGSATKTLPVNSGTPYSFAGGDLIFAVLQVGTTTAQLFYQNTGSSNTVIANVGLTAAAGNLRVMSKVSQAAMPSPLDLTTVAASANQFFVGVT